MNKHIVILGPAHPFRGGGITTFNERLANEFQQQGYRVTIYNFTLQYPSFLFPGKTQYSTEKAPENLNIVQKLNSINPLNWLSVGNELKQLKPDIIIVRFWIPFMGAAFGTVLRRVRKNHFTKIIAITDNVIPHEKRIGDTGLTSYFLKSCDAFVTMSDKVTKDLQQFINNKPFVQTAHPLYDSFGAAVDKVTARKHLGLRNDEKVLLFFGFIRKYKGLDLLLDALQLLKQQHADDNIKLLIAGEFYESEEMYLEKIKALQIENMLLLKNDFIADEAVKYYFGAADVVIQPYRNATQSGVTPLAYHFEKPMIVTNVGALPDYVPHMKVGIVCEPDATSIADAIKLYFEKGEPFFLPGLIEEKQQYSWHNFTQAIETLAAKIDKT